MAEDFSARARMAGPPPERGLPMVVALSGPSDAAFTIRRFGALASSLEHSREVCVFDPDSLYDYRAHPSVARISSSRFSEVALPGVTVRECRDLSGSGFVLVSGVAPDFGWLGFAKALVDMCSAWECSAAWVLQAIPWQVPHTRPVSVWAISPDLPLVSRSGAPAIDVDVSPAPFASLVQVFGTEQGVTVHVPSARVPLYVSKFLYDPALAAVVEFVQRECGLTLPEVTLDPSVDAQLTARWASHPLFAEVLAAMERAYDDESRSDFEVPESFVAEIERFLEDCVPPRADSDGGA